MYPQSVDDCFDTVHRAPSPAPDGTRLVYENAGGYTGPYTLRFFDLATHAVTAPGVPGQRPRWSPNGDLIAYWNADQIWVMRPDGTGQRALSPTGHPYVYGEPAVTWSPDGKYLLARGSTGLGRPTTVVLLDVATGAEIPLPYASTYGVPAWRPTP